MKTEVFYEEPGPKRFSNNRNNRFQIKGTSEYRNKGNDASWRIVVGRASSNKHQHQYQQRKQLNASQKHRNSHEVNPQCSKQVNKARNRNNKFEKKECQINKEANSSHNRSACSTSEHNSKEDCEITIDGSFTAVGNHHKMNGSAGLYRNCGYIPRKRTGGACIDVETSLEWKKTCPAFGMYRSKNKRMFIKE